METQTATRISPLTPAERLIVAADFTLDPAAQKAQWPLLIEDRLHSLAIELHGTGVTIKANSAARAIGAGRFVDLVHRRGLKAFADLKLHDIPETMETDAELLAPSWPDMLTVHCDAGVAAMRRVKDRLPGTTVLGITVLTSISKEEHQRCYRMSISERVRELSIMANDAGIDGLVCSAAEVAEMRHQFPNMVLVVPGIRPTWSIVDGDDQARIATPQKAIKDGADYIVVGRPIMRSAGKYHAVRQTIADIEQGLALR